MTANLMKGHVVALVASEFFDFCNGDFRGVIEIVNDDSFVTA